MSCRAEVLFQPDLLCLRKVFCKAPDVTDVGAPPTIDGLVVIADREQLSMPGRQQSQPRILGLIDVLVFVGQHRVETPRPAAEILAVRTHGPDRPKKQVAEVGCVGVA